ncbi:hypothetical protein HDU96_007196 [Phlyctochytrium bullatum]|nr:hypothetical protein HDU96_007196 [Phlyctochytrium bullatum]
MRDLLGSLDRDVFHIRIETKLWDGLGVGVSDNRDLEATVHETQCMILHARRSSKVAQYEDGDMALRVTGAPRNKPKNGTKADQKEDSKNPIHDNSCKMDASILQTIEDAAEKFYRPKSNEDQRQAEQALAYHFPTFSESNFGFISNASPTIPMTPLDSITNCQHVLERSNSTCAQMFAVSQLRTLVVSHFTFLALDQKLELRKCLLGHRVNLEQYVISGIAGLFCVVTKLGWYDADQFQNVLRDLSAFLDASIEHRLVAVQLLACLVNEMNNPVSTQKSMVRHRKIAVNFRDTQLLQIFQLSLAILRQITSKHSTFNNTREEKLAEYNVNLIKNCLSFDFIGKYSIDSVSDILRNKPGRGV